MGAKGGKAGAWIPKARRVKLSYCSKKEKEMERGRDDKTQGGRADLERIHRNHKVRGFQIVRALCLLGGRQDYIIRGEMPFFSTFLDTVQVRSAGRCSLSRW